MGQLKSPKKLAKFLAYVLGRRPDEFGLVPDPDGYVRIKDLLKAFSEEEGWRHVRRAALEEVILTLPDPPVEIDENRIRARVRDRMPTMGPVWDIPKLLYTCVRQKAHPVVVHEGISPVGGHPWVILSPQKEMAERMGRRIDPAPVLLTVQVERSEESGVVFRQAGELLCLAEYIPMGCFTAPPLPKEKAEAKKKETPREEQKPGTPGSFILDFPDPEKKKKDRHDKRKRISSGISRREKCAGRNKKCGLSKFFN
ncbi:phosphotransferase KptA/Tpt1 [Desulfonema ishimotonii]|uniref:Phosphotransferase KptA/Tpt1 n=1 Tax=Desulfonema ishimotonii TaxID=45657 RepID=A0A401G173_9BACT|nr:RNA 2'-phosphotransferase [Desulfonema ishimotonii]GBC62960.1 phosphotransferase KptA/Tpt1 [Desulfonema ishimotonii]